MRHHPFRRTALRTLAATTALAAALAVVAVQPPGEVDGAVTPVAAKVSAKRIAAATPGDFTGYGFDQCLAPTQKAMDAWWDNSPFSAVGIYISGDSRACRNQPNLTPAWVRNQVAKGWRLLPIALGPQASCLSRFPRYKDDFTISPNPRNTYAKARRQGTAEAVKNATDAARLGIGKGSTIWYDLEAFNTSKTRCRESALHFTSAWVKKTKALGYTAGFYSSASSGIKILDDARRERPDTFALPDRIWIARWDGVANTSTTYIGEEGWRPGGRMKQYRGGHNEKWGGVTINIDSNFIDLGAGSRRPATARPCGGVRVSFRSYPALGSSNSPKKYVRTLQCLLTGTGHYTGEVTGSYDAATRGAVRAWQASRKLRRSNTFSASHWTALLAGDGPTVVKRGSSGPAVYRIQRALNASGANIAADGLFGASTEAALKKYQSRNRITVSGVGTTKTWAALRAGRV